MQKQLLLSDEKGEAKVIRSSSPVLISVTPASMSTDSMRIVLIGYPFVYKNCFIIHYS